MSYGSLSSRFTPKQTLTEDDIREYLRKHYGLDEDSELTSIDTYSLISFEEDGTVVLEISDEIGGEDFDSVESEWKQTVKNFADFSNGAVHVTGDYENDDGEKSDLDYWVGPKALVLQAEIKELEERRDAIERDIAEKRRELSNAQVPEEAQEA